MEWLNKLINALTSVFPRVVLINPTQRAARITCGKRYKALVPGLYFMWPLIQEVIYMEVVTQVVDLPPQTIRMLDGQEIVASGAIRYHIVDIEKALFSVDDVDKALVTLALGVILEYFQTQTLDKSVDLGGIKRELRKQLASEAGGWGVKIEAVYLTDYGRVWSLRLFGDTKHG